MASSRVKIASKIEAYILLKIGNFLGGTALQKRVVFRKLIVTKIHPVCSYNGVAF